MYLLLFPSWWLSAPLGNFHHVDRFHPLVLVKVIRSPEAQIGFGCFWLQWLLASHRLGTILPLIRLRVDQMPNPEKKEDQIRRKSKEAFSFFLRTTVRRFVPRAGDPSLSSRCLT